MPRWYFKTYQQKFKKKKHATNKIKPRINSNTYLRSSGTCQLELNAKLKVSIYNNPISQYHHLSHKIQHDYLNHTPKLVNSTNNTSTNKTKPEFSDDLLSKLKVNGNIYLSTYVCWCGFLHSKNIPLPTLVPKNYIKIWILKTKLISFPHNQHLTLSILQIYVSTNHLTYPDTRLKKNMTSNITPLWKIFNHYTKLKTIDCYKSGPSVSPQQF